MKLQTLAATPDTGEVRVEESRGDKYLVAPTILIREGVLKDTLVPFDQIAASVPFWNGRPVTAPPEEGTTAASIPPSDVPNSGHPLDENGEFASANQDPYLDDMKIGHLRNAEAVEDINALRAETWLNLRLIEEVGTHARAVAEHVAGGEALDVSTGYWYGFESASGTHNGSEYSEVAHDIVPDHLAMLPTETGECSWSDGCGIPRLNQAEADAVNAAVGGKVLTAHNDMSNPDLDDEAQSLLARLTSRLAGGGDDADANACGDGCGCDECGNTNPTNMTDIDIDMLAEATGLDAETLEDMDEDNLSTMSDNVLGDDDGADDASTDNSTDTDGDGADDAPDIAAELQSLREELEEVKNHDPIADKRREALVEEVVAETDYEADDLDSWPTDALAEVAGKSSHAASADRLNATNYGPGAGHAGGADESDEADDYEPPTALSKLRADGGGDN